MCVSVRGGFQHLSSMSGAEFGSDSRNCGQCLHPPHPKTLYMTTQAGPLPSNLTSHCSNEAQKSEPGHKRSRLAASTPPIEEASGACWKMRVSSVTLALVLGVFGPFSADAAAANPIRKVVTLLQKMQTQVTDEGIREQKLYDEFMCYCHSSGDTLAQGIDWVRRRGVVSPPHPTPTPINNPTLPIPNASCSMWSNISRGRRATKPGKPESAPPWGHVLFVALQARIGTERSEATRYDAMRHDATRRDGACSEATRSEATRSGAQRRAAEGRGAE